LNYEKKIVSLIILQTVQEAMATSKIQKSKEIAEEQMNDKENTKEPPSIWSIMKNAI